MLLIFFNMVDGFAYDYAWHIIKYKVSVQLLIQATYILLQFPPQNMTADGLLKASVGCFESLYAKCHLSYNVHIYICSCVCKSCVCVTVHSYKRLRMDTTQSLLWHISCSRTTCNLLPACSTTHCCCLQ